MISVRQTRAASAGPGRIGEAVRLLAFCLLLMGLLARGSIPIGYMPERDVESGNLMVTMCSGADEMQTIHMAADQVPGKGKTAGQHCPFAGLSSPALPEPGPEVDTPVKLFHAALNYSPRDSARIHAAWSASAPPTGPPQFA